MPTIKKHQFDTPGLKFHFTKNCPGNTIVFQTNSDSTFGVHRSLNSILNVSSKILSFTTKVSFLGFLTSWYFNVPILGSTKEDLINLSAKAFITNVGLIIPKALLDCSEGHGTITIIESHHSKQLNF